MFSFFNLTKATRREAQATRAIYSKWSGLISIERASWLFIVRITRKGFLQESFEIFEKFSKTMKKVDVIELLYNELSSSQIKRERHVVDFIEWARPFMNKISELRVRKSDFDLVKVIGRGAFGEVGLVQMKARGPQI